MQINVQFDTRALRTFTAKQQRRLAFNTAQALNETAKKIQTAERVNLDRKLEIRQAGFMYRLIKIVAFASARAARPFAEIAIDPTKRRVLLGKLEAGGMKESEKGRTVAVPLTGTPARPSFAQPVPQQLYLSKLRFRRRRGAKQLVGQQRTYLVRGVGVFQRDASGESRLIYSFENRPRLKAVLEFIPTARRVFAAEWAKQFARAYRKP